MSNTLVKNTAPSSFHPCTQHIKGTYQVKHEKWERLILII